MGAAHPHVSGFRGPWLRTVKVFNNMYFSRLHDGFDDAYENVTLSNGNWQWQNDAKEMMIPADRALILDSEMEPYVAAYATDKSLFYQDFAVIFQRLQELGNDLSANEYVNLQFESGTCPPGEEKIERDIVFDPKLKLTYLVDQKSSTIKFTLKSEYTGWASFGFGNSMVSGIDGYLIKMSVDGWTVENIYT